MLLVYNIDNNTVQFHVIYPFSIFVSYFTYNFNLKSTDNYIWFIFYMMY